MFTVYTIILDPGSSTSPQLEFAAGTQSRSVMKIEKCVKGDTTQRIQEIVIIRMHGPRKYLVGVTVSEGLPAFQALSVSRPCVCGPCPYYVKFNGRLEKVPGKNL